jgi:phage shock protein C
LPALSFPRFCSFRPPLRCRSPEAEIAIKETAMNGRFLVNRRDAKVMGVAAGLADYSGVDPLIIRLGFVALTLLTGPVMILFYVLTGLLAPRQ